MNVTPFSETARQFVTAQFNVDVLRTLCRIHNVSRGNGSKRDMAVNLLTAGKVKVNLSAVTY